MAVFKHCVISRIVQVLFQHNLNQTNLQPNPQPTPNYAAETQVRYRLIAALCVPSNLESPLRIPVMATKNSPRLNRDRKSPTGSFAAQRFTYLLRTNDVPLEDEAAQVQEMLNGAVEDLNQLKEEISRADALLARLHEKRCKLEVTITGYKSVISPVRRLPTEIVSEIARHCLDGEPVFLSTAPKQEERNAWTLAQVCSPWRSKLLAYKKLWSFIQLDLPLTKRARNHGAFLTHELLKRSGGSSLRLNVQINVTSNANEAGFEPLDLCILRPACWKHVSISVDGNHVGVLGRLNKAKGNFSSLESLHMDVYSDPHHAAPNLLLDAFEDAPCLTEVTHWRSPAQLQVNLPPLRQLEVYKESTFHKTHVLEFNSLSNLTECSLGYLDKTHPLPTSPVRIAHLHTMEVFDQDVLDLLILPSLDHLTLRGIPEQWTPVVKLITRSSCQLKTLRIIQGGVRAQERFRDRPVYGELGDTFIQLLQLVPSLEFLHFACRHAIAVDSLASILMANVTTGEALLPNLGILTIVGRANDSYSGICLDQDLLIRMVASRGVQHVSPSGSVYRPLSLFQIAIYLEEEDTLPEPLQDEFMRRFKLDDSFKGTLQVRAQLFEDADLPEWAFPMPLGW